MSALIWITKFAATLVVAIFIDGLFKKAATAWALRKA